MSLVAIPVQTDKLSAEQMKRLRLKLGGTATIYVGKDTTEHQAGFMLGVQHVLHILGVEGFAVDGS